MSKTIKTVVAKKATAKPSTSKKASAKPATAKRAPGKKATAKAKPALKKSVLGLMVPTAPLVSADGTAAPSGVDVMDRLFATISSRKGADPSVSHSARLLSRGREKVAQKFGEEAVECLIEAVAGNRAALIAESADVLYHLLVLWVDADVQASEVWAELERRQGVSGIAEKAARAQKLSIAHGLGTTKIA